MLTMGGGYPRGDARTTLGPHPAAGSPASGSRPRTAPAAGFTSSDDAATAARPGAVTAAAASARPAAAPRW
ncbi:hypothetical protein GCM10009660_51990 [Catellatospora bangladeshensis]